MTATSRAAEDESPGQAVARTAEATEATAPAETGSLIGIPVDGGTCAVCGAELATDQRYCVECGTRRGPPRFTAKLPSQQTSASATSATRRSSRRPSSLFVVVAVATLLIAFGVGLLVGHDSSGKAPTVNIQLHGVGGSASSANAGSGGNGGSGSSGSSGSGSGGSGSGGSGSGSKSSGSGGSGSGSKSSGNFFG
jgi:hypothetical protein